MERIEYLEEKISLYMEFMERQLIEEFGNPNELTEMFNISREIDIIFKGFKGTFSLLFNKEDEYIGKEFDIEILKATVSTIEKEVLESNALLDRACEICERNEKVISKVTLEKGERYGNLFRVLTSELKLKITSRDAEKVKILYAIVSWYFKKNENIQAESDESMQMTLEKLSTTPKAE